jgi:hypothetical protein
MKKATLLLIAIALTFSLHAQQWTGSSNTTGLTYRDGNVLIGGTTFSGTFGSAERILQLQGNGTWLTMLGSSTTSFNLSNGGSGTGMYSWGGPISFWTSSSGIGSKKMTIGTDGTVGIGTAPTTNPNGYKLAVNGKIGAKEVQVENTSSTWADYVFKPDYKLMPLQEVETFVKANSHLPEVPSAEEIKVNGHKLGEMDVLLLKKVEELTLYVIDLKKEVEKIKKENEQLKADLKRK